MKVTFVIYLDKHSKVSDNSHPVCIQIRYNGNNVKKRIRGYSCKLDHWDFQNNQFNVHERAHEKKNDYINEYLRNCKTLYENNFYDSFDYKEFSKLLKGEKKEQESDKRLSDFAKQIYNEKIAQGDIPSAKNYGCLIPVFEKAGIHNTRLRDFDESTIKKMLQSFDEREMSGFNYLKWTKTLLSFALKKGVIETKHNPFKTSYNLNGYDINERKKKGKKNVSKKRIKDLTEEEKEQVVRYYYNNTFSPKEKKYLAYWVLSYFFFGVNLIDLAHLEWKDINNDLWNYSRSKTGFENRLGKPVREATLDILKEYDTGKKYILDILNGYDRNPVTKERRLKRYRDNCYKCYKRVSKKIDFGDGRYFSYYSGRYTAPTLALSKGADINTVKTLMDHSNIKTTNKYLGIVRDREKLQNAMNLL